MQRHECETHTSVFDQHAVKGEISKETLFGTSNMPLVEAKKPPTCANCVVSIFHFQDDQIQ